MRSSLSSQSSIGSADPLSQASATKPFSDRTNLVPNMFYSGANFTPIPADFASFKYKSGGKSMPKETGGKGKSKTKAEAAAKGTADKEVVVAKKRKTRGVK